MFVKTSERLGLEWERLLSLLLLLLITVVSPFNLFSQEYDSKPTRQSSLEAFSEGDYEKAYREFRDLLVTYPRDPLYKYYSGVCLINLNRDHSEAVKLLHEAVEDAAVIRSLPSDALFYLGRAQQLSGMFTEAIVSYNSYTDQVGRRDASRKGVPRLIEECNQHKGAAEVKETPVITEETEDESDTGTIMIGDDRERHPVDSDEVIISDNSSDINDVLPEGYEEILDEALVFQFRADSLSGHLLELKGHLGELTGDSLSKIKAIIGGEERLVDSLQEMADRRYDKAQQVMNNLQIVAADSSDNILLPDSSTDDDSVVSSEGKDTEGFESDSVLARMDDTEIDQPAVCYYFEILPETITDKSKSITIDPDIPEGLIYRIQVAVFRNPVSPGYFKGITPVYGFTVTGTDMTNYYAGLFRRIADARSALDKVRDKGFNDAFLVPFYEGKTVSADRAAALEKEWGPVPFGESVDREQMPAADTVPPTLILRVEVARSQEPLEQEAVDDMKRIAGGRGFDIQPLDDGGVVYLIGKFITFESAEEYAGLLVRNGFRDARVVAWIGNLEIPVETARSLFDRLE